MLEIIETADRKTALAAAQRTLWYLHSLYGAAPDTINIRRVRRFYSAKARPGARVAADVVLARKILRAIDETEVRFEAINEKKIGEISNAVRRFAINRTTTPGVRKTFNAARSLAALRSRFR